MKLISRISPTPSGYLHEGNAFNFLLTWAMARAYDGHLILRIDDADEVRVRPEYIQSIFRDLEWLGLDWDEGPGSPEEQNLYSHTGKKEIYRETFHHLQNQELLFPCDCSRKDLEEAYEYTGKCIDTVPESGPFAWRFSPKLPSKISLLNTHGSKVTFDTPYSMNQTIVWRKDDIPAYQLISLLEDIESGVNLIVRGKDLRESSLFQMHLSQFLPENSFQNVRFIHHPLVRNKDGKKLSKSEGALALQTMREEGLKPEDLYQRFSRWMGWEAPASSLEELLPRVRADFKWAEEVY